MTKLLWKPKLPQASQLWQFMAFVQNEYSVHCTDYAALHRWSIEHLEDFWQALVDFYAIKLTTPVQEVLTEKGNIIEASWFKGASFNFAEKLLAGGADDSPALISILENQERLTLDYRQLRQEVANCAAALRKAGIQPGDRIAGILPNSHYAVIAMLATASLGAIWSSCSTDFGAKAIVDRLGQIEPSILFISDTHQYQGKTYNDLDKLAEIEPSFTQLKKIVICATAKKKSTDININNNNNNNNKWYYWDDFLIPSSHIQFPAFPFSHPLYLLFSSGTTGKPKCILHSAGGSFLQHLKELGLHTDLSSLDKLFFYTTCGWMMWNWMISALALGTPLVLYEGSPTFPNALRLFEIIAQEKVTVFGTSAKFISTVEKAEVKPKDNCNLSTLRTILSTGSPLLPKNYDFVYGSIKSDVQLSSISGGTDIVSCFALGNPILPIYRGELQCLGLGMAVDVFDNQGQPTTQRGELVCTKPFPSMPLGFWNDPKKIAYQKAYFSRFPQVWAHGDYAEITPHQGLIIYGRSDAVLNPGGVRIGTAEIYRQIEDLTEIQDSVVIAQDWGDDVRIVLFVKLKNGLILSSSLQEQIKHHIRHHASPRHVPAKIIQVPDIPRTINNKTVELAVRQVVHGQPVQNRESLANPEALDYFKDLPELQS